MRTTSRKRDHQRKKRKQKNWTYLSTYVTADTQAVRQVVFFSLATLCRR